MARPGITYEQVQSAANSLWKQGLSPSIQKIRETLGTGSNSTIATHLKRWQQERTDNSTSVLPSSIPEKVIEAVEAFWEIAFGQAESNFDSYRMEMLETVARAEQQRDRASAELALINDEAKSLRQKLTRAQSKSRELEKHLLVEEERVAAVELRHNATKERLTRAHETIEQLREEIKIQTSQHNNALQQLRVALECRIAEAEQRLTFERERGEANEARLMHLLDQEKTEHNRAKTRFAQEHQSWEEQKIAFRQKISAAENRIAALESTNTDAEQTNHRLRAQLQQEEIASKAGHGRYLKTARLVDELRTRLKAANTDRRRLERLLTSQAK